MGKFKEIIEILSKVSTVGIFILALFGYFYTVKPKFELDNLKLSMESVKKEKNDLEFQIKEFKNDISGLKTEKDDLVNLLVTLNSEKDNLLLSLNKLNENYKNDVTLLENKIKTYDTSILKKESYINELNNKVNEYNLNLFVFYLFNGVDTFNENENDYTKFVFSFIPKSLDEFNEKPKLLNILDNHKFFLNNNAPYIVFMKKINNYNYEKNMIFSNKQFFDMKKDFINKVNLHKDVLNYDSDYFNNYLLDLNNKRQVHLDSLNSLEKSLNFLEKEKEKISKYEYLEKENKIKLDIYLINKKLTDNESEYFTFINNEYKKINFVIKKFINEFIF